MSKLTVGRNAAICSCGALRRTWKTDTHLCTARCKKCGDGTIKTPRRDQAAAKKARSK